MAASSPRAPTTTPVAIGLGTNRGDRLENLRRAAEPLRRLLSDPRPAPVYRSAPEDGSAQADYFNTAVVGACELEAEALLAQLKLVELSSGRRRAARNAPRVLDLDLLLYGEKVSRRAELALPHPRLGRRAFVLTPLADIAPDWRVPPMGDTVETLLNRLGEANLRRLAGADDWFAA